MDEHIRRNNRRGYHHNRREGNRDFPGLDISGSGWTLKQIREHVRGKPKPLDDVDDAGHDDDLGDNSEGIHDDGR